MAYTRRQTDSREVKVDFRLNETTLTVKENENEVVDKEGQADSVSIQPSLTFRERYLAWRYGMVVLLQASFVVAVFLRNSMPVALVCMAKPPPSASSKPLTNDSGANTSYVRQGMMDYSPLGGGVISPEVNDNYTHASPMNSTYEFTWDSRTQSIVLTSSILLGFAGPVLATGLQACTSGKRLLTLATVGGTVLTMLCPTAARISPSCLAAFRVVLSVLFGFNVPVVGDSLAWWSPQEEKLAMVSITFAGINIGAISASLISGFLCSIPIDNGWPFIFYFFGIINMVWGVAWHFLSDQKPEDHPFVSLREREYIIAHRANMENSDEGSKDKPPYGEILRSVPVLAFLVTGCCYVWVVSNMVSYLPIFFVEILGFTVQQAVVLISLVVLARIVGAFLWTVLGNWLSSRSTTGRSRKVCMVTGLSIAGLTLVGMSFFHRSNRWVAFLFLVMSSVAQACGVSTYAAIPLDMAPRYAGLLTGMYMSSSSLIAVSGPPVISALTPKGTHSEWQVVLILLGAVNVLGGVVFGVLGSATLQSWAKVHQTVTEDTDSSMSTTEKWDSASMGCSAITQVSDISSICDGSCDIVTGYQVDFSLEVQASPSPSRSVTSQSPGPMENLAVVQVPTIVCGDGDIVVGGGGDRRPMSGLINEAFDDDESRCGSDENSQEWSEEKT